MQFFFKKGKGEEEGERECFSGNRQELESLWDEFVDILKEWDEFMDILKELRE